MRSSSGGGGGAHPELDASCRARSRRRGESCSGGAAGAPRPGPDSSPGVRAPKGGQRHVLAGCGPHRSGRPLPPAVPLLPRFPVGGGGGGAVCRRRLRRSLAAGPVAASLRAAFIERLTTTPLEWGGPRRPQVRARPYCCLPRSSHIWPRPAALGRPAIKEKQTARRKTARAWFEFKLHLKLPWPGILY